MTSARPPGGAPGTVQGQPDGPIVEAAWDVEAEASTYDDSDHSLGEATASLEDAATVAASNAAQHVETFADGVRHDGAVQIDAAMDELLTDVPPSP